MENFDLATLAGIATATTAAVGGLKMMLPKWTKGKEAILSLAIPIVLGVIAKATGSYADSNWVNFITMIVLGGMAAQIAHDKVINPVRTTLKLKK